MATRSPSYIDDDEPAGFSRAGVLVFMLFALSSAAVLYNLGWREHAPALASAGGQSVIEIDAARGSAVAVPVARATVEVKGSALPPAPALKADPMVAAIERELIAAGYMQGPADGVPGQRLRDGIAAWERRNGYPVTGAARQELLDKLIYARQIREAAVFDAGALAAASAAAAQESPAAEPKAAAEEGDPEIRKAQTVLSELGYRPGPITGELNRQTAAAIEAFERERGLKPTGRVTRQLMKALGEMTGDTALAPAN